jgi:hypothetical protein
MSVMVPKEGVQRVSRRFRFVSFYVSAGAGQWPDAGAWAAKNAGRGRKYGYY